MSSYTATYMSYWNGEIHDFKHHFWNKHNSPNGTIHAIIFIIDMTNNSMIEILYLSFFHMLFYGSHISSIVPLLQYLTFLLFVLGQNVLEAEGPWFEGFLFVSTLKIFSMLHKMKNMKIRIKVQSIFQLICMIK